MSLLMSISRREMLMKFGGGFAILPLIDLLSRDASAASINPLAPKAPHFPAKAKHVVFLFMNGAPSHIDTFDPKPALTKYDGHRIKANSSSVRMGGPIGNLMQSPFEFRKYGAERSRNQQPVPAHFEVR